MNPAFPYPDHGPASLAQLSAHSPVTAPIGEDLGPPKLRVMPRRPIASRTPMPEAPIHEHGDAFPTPNEIGFPWERLMTTPARNIRRTEDGGQAELR
jgi:hypothetical protein